MSKTWILPGLLAAVAAIIVAALGATITDLGPWYQSLDKPGWNPPDIAFPIGWTLIYAFNTYAIVAAWRAAPDSKVSDTIIGLFALNAFLNITWSMIFFRIQRPDWAFVELLLLWLSILALVWYCGRYSKTAALFFLPYLAWVTFAGALNWAVVELNGPFG
ncbi:TspO/MBR family protein [Erythrobacter sp. JK5]|uniref:TspO/MBR family protein n=1 Tax=Erythrobacter sp. JK5 TaxID=2829500 RepID=UPI001BAC8EA6|nr:TspO/MBR family protein [Erythrobacter sp. JK5]QUL38034.1 tryptophan-rich sensory protein [Erythrobacter sp. JK5]